MPTSSPPKKNEDGAALLSEEALEPETGRDRRAGGCAMLARSVSRHETTWDQLEETCELRVLSDAEPSLLVPASGSPTTMRWELEKERGGEASLAAPSRLVRVRRNGPKPGAPNFSPKEAIVEARRWVRFRIQMARMARMASPPIPPAIPPVITARWVEDLPCGGAVAGRGAAEVTDVEDVEDGAATWGDDEEMEGGLEVWLVVFEVEDCEELKGEVEDVDTEVRCVEVEVIEVVVVVVVAVTFWEEITVETTVEVEVSVVSLVKVSRDTTVV